MLTSSKGYETSYLTDQVAAGREGYYTGAVAAGEPAGQWYGRGAAALGLSGEVDADLLEAIFTHQLDPRDPRAHSRETWSEASRLGTPHKTYKSPDELFASYLAKEPRATDERKAELRALAEKNQRSAVKFWDFTFSAPKGVSVAGAAFERKMNDALARGDLVEAAHWKTHVDAVEGAVKKGADAMLKHLEDNAAFSRTGHNGIQSIDTEGIVAAQFLQHDSRDRDPQLHVHNILMNQIECADGVRRSLDADTMLKFQTEAGAVGERVMEADLAQTLGLPFKTTYNEKGEVTGRDIDGIDQGVLDQFSKGKQRITTKSQQIAEDFKNRYGREPSPSEWNKIHQQANFATRPSKSHDGETREQFLDRIEAETRLHVDGGLSQIANDILDRAQQAAPPDTFSTQDVTERALAQLEDKKSSFRETQVMKALNDELPANLGLAPEQVPAFFEDLKAEALEHPSLTRLTPEDDLSKLPDALKLRNGQSAMRKPGSTRYATEGQIAANRMLREAAVKRGAPAMSVEQAQAFLDRYAESGKELSADQRAAFMSIATSGALVETINAAAGTGKSFLMGALAEAWQESETGRLFGTAASQNATDILAEEGIPARNITQWLATQRRLEDGIAFDEDRAFQLRPGDVVTIDEASMASNKELQEIQRRVEQAGAKLIPVGDTHQLGAVGSSGALHDLTEHGLSHELTDVRRFENEWERTASLGLRDGDSSSIDEYAKHGRLHDAGTRDEAMQAAANAWLGDTLSGKESLLTVPTNEQAAELSAQLRQKLVELGKVQEHGVTMRDGNLAGIGDRIQARHNDWTLKGQYGNTKAPINRETYEVTGHREDGGLSVRHSKLGFTLELPPEYVQEHMTSAYARTVHAAQGRTVDTAHSVFGPGIDANAAYTAMTRGKEANHVWGVTQTTNPYAPQDLDVTDTPARTTRAMLSDVMEQAEQERSALAEREQAELEAKSTATNVDQLIHGIGHVTNGRTQRWLDEMTAAGTLSNEDRERLAAEDSRDFDSLDRLLRQTELAGHDPKQVLADSIQSRSLDNAKSISQTLQWRINTTLKDDLKPKVESAADLIPRDVPEQWQSWLQQRAEAADDRRRELAEQIANDPPQWAIETLGSVPDDPIERAEWEYKAGYAAAYRELASVDDDTNPLGSPPPKGLPEKYATWRTAHNALDLPDAGADEKEMTDGQLRLRSAAWDREQEQAPPYVADELRTKTTQLDERRREASLKSAQADAAADQATAAQLRAEAEQAQQEADELASRVKDLEFMDDVRGQWYAHTAPTRDTAYRSDIELNDRGIDRHDPAEQTTAQEWLDEQDKPTAEVDTQDDEINDTRAETSNVAEDVRRAQEALRRIEEQRNLDETRQHEEADQRESMARWDEEVQRDRAEQAQTREDDYGMSLGR